MLSKVCLRVHELSDFVIHDFLALWVLGSLLDNTKDVDMVYRRRHSVLRILIACIDYSLIQERLDVFINVGIFKLHFQVEAPKNKQVIDDVIMNDANDDGDDHDPSKTWRIQRLMKNQKRMRMQTLNMMMSFITKGRQEIVRPHTRILRRMLVLSYLFCGLVHLVPLLLVDLGQILWMRNNAWNTIMPLLLQRNRVCQ